MKPKIQTKDIHYHKCPACAGVMQDKKYHNCQSRYQAMVFICTPCGTREAFEGFFWKAKWDEFSMSIRAEQKDWDVP